MRKHQSTVGKRAALITQPLFIEGITRSGKFLVANILSGFSDIDPVQYDSLMETLPFLSTFSHIEPRTAMQILQCQTDLHAYEMIIGRNFNYRKSDKSSIFNIPNHELLLNRSEEEDRDKLVSEWLKAERRALFILHEGLPHIKFYFKTYHSPQVISLVRHPIDLMHSWLVRGLGKRWGNDPTLFQIPFQKKGSVIPWFAESWAQEYLSASEGDRVVLSIEYLTRASNQGYHALTPKEKKQVYQVSFEKLLSDPTTIITELSIFLKKEPLPVLEQILTREKLPQLDFKKSRDKKIIDLKAAISPKLWPVVTTLVEQYESK